MEVVGDALLADWTFGIGRAQREVGKDRRKVIDLVAGEVNAPLGVSDRYVDLLEKTRFEDGATDGDDEVVVGHANGRIGDGLGVVLKLDRLKLRAGDLKRLRRLAGRTGAGDGDAGQR